MYRLDSNESGYDSILTRLRQHRSSCAVCKKRRNNIVSLCRPCYNPRNCKPIGSTRDNFSRVARNENLKIEGQVPVNRQPDKFGLVPPWNVPAFRRLTHGQRPGALDAARRILYRHRKCGVEFGRVRRPGVLDSLLLAGKQSSEEIEGPSCPSATYLL
jgi:hypothetical protein